MQLELYTVMCRKVLPCVRLVVAPVSLRWSNKSALLHCCIQQLECFSYKVLNLYRRIYYNSQAFQGQLSTTIQVDYSGYSDGARDSLFACYLPVIMKRSIAYILRCPHLLVSNGSLERDIFRRDNMLHCLEWLSACDKRAILKRCNQPRRKHISHSLCITTSHSSPLHASLRLDAALQDTLTPDMNFIGRSGDIMANRGNMAR